MRMHGYTRLPPIQIREAAVTQLFDPGWFSGEPAQHTQGQGAQQAQQQATRLEKAKQQRRLAKARTLDALSPAQLRDEVKRRLAAFDVGVKQQQQSRAQGKGWPSWRSAKKAAGYHRCATV
jgi:hypothetical protein